MARVKLTARKVESLRTTRLQEDFWDSLVPGLALRVGRGGRKSWIVRYRVGGTHRRLKIGVVPRLDLADARVKARAVLAAADNGADPAEESVQDEQDTTFKALAKEVLAARARNGRNGPTRERTQHERQRILDTELSGWHAREAASITRREVVLLIEKIAERAPVMANRTLSLIRLIFNDGLSRDWPTLESSPAHKVKPAGHEEGRDRFLTRDEIRTVWKATESENVLTRAAFRLSLLTAARIGSVLAMRWSDIDDEGVWIIPAESFKGKRPMAVPLNEQALAIVEELRRIKSDDVWVFPARAGTKRGHISNLGGALARIRKRTQIPHWVAHDFRETFRTHITKLGTAGHVADAALGHAEDSLGWSRYQGDRLYYLLPEKREALVKWGSFVARAVAS